MDIMRENAERKPQQYIDEQNGIPRNVWEEATPLDLFAVQDRMYHQSRKRDEPLDGKQWASHFKGYGLGMVSKINMELFQNQYNRVFNYTQMRDFLRSEFGIETPLPRHEKIEYPYEEHNEAFERANFLGTKEGPGLNPEDLGSDFDPNDPKYQSELDVALAQAKKILEETDIEATRASQRATRLESDIEAVEKIIGLDLLFEAACKERDIDPHAYALHQYEKRSGPEGKSFEEAMAELRSFDPNLLLEGQDLEQHQGTQKPAEQGPDYAPEPPPDHINFDAPGDAPVGEDRPQASNSGEPAKTPTPSRDPSISAPPSNAPSAPDAKPNVTGEINKYLEQIQKQDPANKDNGKSRDQYNRDSEAVKDNGRGFGGISLAMPFVPRLGAMTTGIVSYPTKKFRDYRDTSFIKRNVSASNENLLRQIKDVGDNFDSYNEGEKVSAARRLQEAVENYRDDIEAANGHLAKTGDRSLAKFMNEHKKDFSPEKMNKIIDDNLSKHEELANMVKHMKQMMEMVRNLLRAIGRVFSNSKSGPSPSP